MSPLLEVTDLRTEIRRRDHVVRAVDGVSLTLDAGETLGLVGESGCGKTMTGRSLMRLLPPGGRIAGGSVRFGDRELTTLSDDEMRRVRGGDIAMVFQEPLTALNPTLTVGRQIAEVARIHWGSSPAAALDRAVEVLDLVGMPHPRKRLDAYPHELSGGLRQRCVIAMALACEPSLLIADEPTTALDVTIQAQILELLGELKERLDMALLLVTHDLGVIAGQADRVMVMYAGRIVEEAPTEQLFAAPEHPYTEALLQAVPQLDGDTRQELRNIPGLPPDLARPPEHCRFQPRCSRATERCGTEDPALAAGDDPWHRFACFHPVGEQATDRRAQAHPRGETRVDSPEVGKPLLEVVDVTKDIPVTAGAVLQRRVGTISAVSDVSFTVEVGETLGVVGESGCGKTTLGRMIVALERPTSGSVLLDGVDLGALRGRRLRERRRVAQLVFQDPYSSLDPRMRVGSTLREPLLIQGTGSRRDQDRTTARLLDEVGLAADAVHRYPHEFSGGQRQRIGLARALALQPKLIVADEPVSALDVSIQAQILNLMKRLQADHGLTYVFISHDLSVVRSLADRIGVMYLGKLVELGASDDVYRRPAHPYTAGLLAAVPLPDPDRERRRERARVAGELPSPLDPPSGCRFRTRCPLAQDVCAAEPPPVHAFGDGHTAACHFPLQPPAEPVSGEVAAR